MTDTLSFGSKDLVEYVLRSRVQTGQVFISAKTDCVGCRLARFCTLEEVAENYNLDLGRLISDLNLSVQNVQFPRRSE